MSEIIGWLKKKLSDGFVNVGLLPSYLSHRQADGGLFLYGRSLTRVEVDEVVAALPSLTGGATALEAVLLLQDEGSSERAFESARVGDLVGLLVNESLASRSRARDHLTKRAKKATAPELETLLEALAANVGQVVEISNKTERAPLVSMVRGIARQEHPGTIRRLAIHCLLVMDPNAATEFVTAPLHDRLAAVDALAGHPRSMEFLLDEDTEVVASARKGLAERETTAVLDEAVSLMKRGSRRSRLAAVAAIEPLLSLHWRPLLEPLVTLVGASDGELKTGAGRVLGLLAKTRRLPRRELERIAKALKDLPQEFENVRALLPGASTPSDNPLRTIELQLEAGGSDESWAVYADALLSVGDVRGQLVANAHNPRRLKALVKKHSSELFGPLEALVGPSLAGLGELSWSHGFVEGAVVGRTQDVSLEDVLRALLDSPAARFVSRLELGLNEPGDDNNYAPAIETLGDSGGAHLIESLLLGRFDAEEAEMSWSGWGDVSALWRTCPGLTRLHLRGAGGDLGTVHSTMLESFMVETGGLSRRSLSAIAKAKLPKLCHLEVWFGDSGYGGECTVGDAEKLLARKDVKLRSLGLKNAEFTHQLIPILARWKPLRALEVLDLSKGVFSDEDVDGLLRHRAAFAHLRTLDLSENLIETRAQELRKALPNVVVKEQRSMNGDRYVAVGE